MEFYMLPETDNMSLTVLPRFEMCRGVPLITWDVGLGLMCDVCTTMLGLVLVRPRDMGLDALAHSGASSCTEQR